MYVRLHSSFPCAQLDIFVYQPQPFLVVVREIQARLRCYQQRSFPQPYTQRGGVTSAGQGASLEIHVCEGRAGDATATAAAAQQKGDLESSRAWAEQ